MTPSIRRASTAASCCSRAGKGARSASSPSLPRALVTTTATGSHPSCSRQPALAFWHDHPLRDGEGAAGPSGAIGPSLVTAWGDRWIAYLRGIDGLVFTPTDGGSFSVVFFNAEGEALDLGRFAPP